jgi:hypothetical protein
MTPADYAGIPGTQPWADPVSPGLNPAIPAAATAAQITEAHRVWTTAQQRFSHFVNVRSAIRSALVDAAGPYIEVLADADYGYTNVTPLAMLTHLMTAYADMDQDAITQTHAILAGPFDPSFPIGVYWASCATCKSALQPHEPVTDATLCRIQANTLSKYPGFDEASREWRRKPRVDQTLANLHIHFNQADKERHRTTTASTAGYAASIRPQAQVQPTAATHTPATSLSRIQGCYCWTHGLDFKKPEHTSQSCVSPGVGHCVEATADNMMGGNNRIHRLPNEVVVWKPMRRRRPNTPATQTQPPT